MDTMIMKMYLNFYVILDKNNFLLILLLVIILFKLF